MVPGSLLATTKRGKEMNRSDVLDSFARPLPSGATRIMDMLEDKLESTQRYKKAYMSALVEACNGDKILANKLARKHLGRVSR
jgi:hypothetical protein